MNSYARRWILTAAHCFRSNQTAKVYFGWSDPRHFLGALLVEPENFYPHPDFKYGGGPLNDIGEIELRQMSMFVCQVDALCRIHQVYWSYLTV